MARRCVPKRWKPTAPIARPLSRIARSSSPEGEMKWPDVHPARGEYRFEQADALVDFARQHEMAIRGHTLAWYGGMPAWTETIESRVEAEERELVDHIETLVYRYRGAIPSWDVVNEPLVDWPEGATSLRPLDLDQAAGAGLFTNRAAHGGGDRSRRPGSCSQRIRCRVQGPALRGPPAGADPIAAAARCATRTCRCMPSDCEAHLFADRAIDRDGLPRSFLRRSRPSSSTC